MQIGTICIRQKVNVRQSRFQAKLDWVVIKGYPIATASFDIKLRGNVMKKMMPQDWNGHRDSFELEVESEGIQWPEFCGTGDSDTTGASIDKVSFSNYNKCLTSTIIRY
jgi:hypothetical protein